MARDRAVEHEVHHGAGRVEQELQHRPRPPERRVLPADGRRRVDEHAGAAPVELPEHRFPLRVAEVGPVDVGEQDEPVDVEVVGAVRDLGHRGVDIRKWERAQQTEATGVVDDRAPAGLVDLAGQVTVRGRPSARWTPGVEIDRSDAGDPQAVHQRHVRSADQSGICGMPSGCSWPARSSAAGTTRDVVGVDVELAGSHRRRPKSSLSTASARIGMTLAAAAT